ncbi:LytR/AlgR family response regulator transcription factor [Hymenobacter psychrophilus]|uniref:Two component transcriptional regulator, LytTR family n=1 Tax=Hymenobacter psychrophilus TaxID=651662 RepID=A0A1H3ENI1_9BACT|nr:LytTR family DNA-binding domain-containing protein [Hymenobacter psychrophilus]SDX80271.1 two component transcriptional regulator, LytTR family [Hymenobacter psychrophilus]
MMPVPDSGSRRPVSCIVVDDEPLARKVLVDFCGQVTFLALQGQFGDALAAAAFLQDNPVDVVFLDIQMPRLTGLQLAQLLPAPGPRIIFTTAHPDYAVQSYELPALDYLLKPISFERFVQAAHRARAALLPPAATTATPEAAAADPAAADEVLFVRHDSRLRRVLVDDIYYVEGQKEYLMYYTATGKLLILQSFRKLEEQLPAGRFVRIHKSYLINLRHLEFVERHRVQVHGASLPIGETYREGLLEVLRYHGKFN